MPARSQLAWTWSSRWLGQEERHAPLADELRMSVRISTTPSGSIPIVGSSRMSTLGSLTRASAMPRRWRIPREYWPALRSAAVGQPDPLEHLGIALSACFPRRPLSAAV